NSLNQVATQRSPDGGYSRFWYDRLGRLSVSQNEKQYEGNFFSYTRYDYLGRISEVGEKKQTTAFSQTISRNNEDLSDWLAQTYLSGSNTVLAQQVTRTVYDLIATLPTLEGT